MYWLDILNGPARGRRKIQRRSLVLGSDLSCQFWVDAPGIAPRHAEIVERAGAVMLRLLARAPSDRLKLNGEIVTGERLLSDGDTIEIAGVRIRYRARLPWFERAAPVLRWVVPLAMMVGGLGWWGWRWWMRETGGGVDTTPPAVIEPMVAPTEEPAEVSAETPRLARMEALGEAVQAAATSPRSPQTNIENRVELPPPSPAPPADAPSMPAAREPGPETMLAIHPPQETGAETSAPPLSAAQSEEVRAPEGARPPSPVPAESAFETQIKAAEALGQAGAWERALSLVANVPPTDAGYARVLAIRARAAEQGGRLREAEALWTDVLRVGSGTPLYETAFRELIRLAERQVSLAPPPLLERAATVTGQPPVPAASPPEVPPSVLEAMKAARPPAAVPPPPLPEPSATARTPPPTAAPASPTPATPAPAVPPRSEPPRAPQRTDTPAAAAPEPRAPPTASAPHSGPATGAGETAAPRPAVTTAPPAQVALPMAPTVVEAPSRPEFTVVRADVTRFPADEERDDHRVLSLQIRLDGVREPIPLDRLAVELTFFDRAGDPPQVFASRVARGGQRFNLTGAPWKPGEVRQLTFSYTVPKGARERESREHGAAATYHGYRLRMLYEGRAVSVYARPSDLAELR